jgi:rhodanese-related sulfurtransferase
MEIKGSKLLKVLLLIGIMPIIGIILFALSTMDSPTEDKTEKKSVERILPQNFKDEFYDDDGRIVLDIRTPEEFAIRHLEGAINVDFYEASFRENIDSLDRESEYLLYCNSGNRSASALVMMGEMGFTNVKELAGGIQAWIGDGQETCTDC